MSSFGSPFDDVIDQSRDVRRRTARANARLALLVSVTVAVAWAIGVTVTGHWDRVVDNWASALTMVFGSFVAGSTPQGGGAVAFPVFTKVLGIEASVARSFSLCIQTVGMGVAAISIIINRRVVAWRAVAIATPAALVGFAAAIILLSDGGAPFWPSTLPGPYVKVFFTLIVAAMAVMVYLGFRVQIIERVQSVPIAGSRVVALIAVAGLIGGIASAMVGSGADVLLYLAVVVVIGVSPRVSVPSSVIVMAIVSVVGFVVFGLIDGQLDVTLDANGDVAAVGGEALTDGPLPASEYDLFGLWLAAVPVVAFGAPLGAWASSRVTDRQLVRFVVLLAGAETLGTIVFLDGLLFEPDPALIAFGVVGAVVVIAGLVALKRHRRAILGLPPVDIDRSFTRERLDTGRDFRDQLLDDGGDET